MRFARRPCYGPPTRRAATRTLAPATLEPRDPCARSPCRCILDFAIRLDEGAAEVRELHAAAAAATDAGCCGTVGEHVIDVVEQQPRAPVAHSQLARRLRQRAGRLDALEQRNLAGTERAVRTQIDPQPD